MIDMPFTLVNDIATVFNDTIDFGGTLTNTTAATSLDSTPVAVTTTTATTTAATTTTVTPYTLSLDGATIPKELSPVTLSSETLSHLSKEFFSNGHVCSLQEAVEITT
jgi:hypothetical protein